jgi:hypothetical protein
MKKTITAGDILSPEAYEKIRNEKRHATMEIKRNRRVSVGPYATFYFENYDTMWLQIHEMLRIEKGGAEQLRDELAAYNPLIPNGTELVATVMLEIEDPVRRATILAKLGGIETKMQFKIGNEIVHGIPEKDLEYTSPEGKASSVQFVHFHFTSAQILAFRHADTEATLGIMHPEYSHIAVLPTAVRVELLKDFT